jgi:hypothetical protein
MAADTADRIEGLLCWDLLDDPLVLARCQRQLRSTGAMVVKGFATADGLRRLLDEVSLQCRPLD